MKKMLLTTSALALALSLPVAANALSLGVKSGIDVSAGVSAGTNASGGSTSNSTAAGGSANGSANVNTVVEAMSTDQAEISAIADLGADSKVEVMKIGAVGKTNAVVQAMTQNAQAAADLQAAINAQADLKSQLEANDIDVSTIIAADVAADGTLVLYSNS